jgi:Sec-independent protein translocase protein TatA
MDFLGIGPLELVFILIIALIVLGPKDMVKAGRTIGRLLRSIVTSPNWRAIQQTSREIRTLPNRLMREAGLEEISRDMPSAKQIQNEAGMETLKDWGNELGDWTTPPTIGTPPTPPEGEIKPPQPDSEAESKED